MRLYPGSKKLSATVPLFCGTQRREANAKNNKKWSRENSSRVGWSVVSPLVDRRLGVWLEVQTVVGGCPNGTTIGLNGSWLAVELPILTGWRFDGFANLKGEGQTVNQSKKIVKSKNARKVPTMAVLFDAVLLLDQCLRERGWGWGLGVGSGLCVKNWMK